MRRVLYAGLIAALATAPVEAQSVETVARYRDGATATSQTDLAVRVSVPHLMVESGWVETIGMKDAWVYGVVDVTLGRITLIGEGFVAPNGDYLSKTSVGGAANVKLTDRLVSSNRFVTYTNPDKSKQNLFTTGLDFNATLITLGGSVGGLTGKGTIGQARISRSSPLDQTLVYASNNMEVPDMPWATWVVREVGITERVKLLPRFSVLVGYAAGELDDNRYQALTFGGRYSF